MPVFTYDEKMELKNQKSRKKNSKKSNSNLKKTLLQKEAEFINDVYDI